jgi:hypothetical protein
MVLPVKISGTFSPGCNGNDEILVRPRYSDRRGSSLRPTPWERGILNGVRSH